MFHQLEELHRHFEVDLHCLTFRRISAEDLEVIQGRCQRVTVHKLSWLKAAFRLGWSVFSRRPFQVLLFTERGLVRSIRHQILNAQPDVLLAQMVRTAEYVKDHGGIDLGVERQYLSSTIGTLLNVLLKKAEAQAKQDSNVTIDKSLQAVS